MNDFYGKTTGKIRRFRLKELLLNRAVTLFNELGLLGEVFKKRPLLLPAFLLLSCCFLSYITVTVIPSVCLCILVVIVSFFHAKRTRPFNVVLTGIMLCSILIYSGFVISSRLSAYQLPGQDEFYCRITGLSRDLSGDTDIVVKLDGGSYAVLKYYGNDSRYKSLNTGDVIIVSGSIKDPEKAGNPGEFDYRGYLRKQGILYVVKCDSFEIAARAGFPANVSGVIQNLFSDLRKNTINAVTKGFDRSSRALAAAVCLGDKSLISEDIRREFKMSCCSHLLAVSGTHFAGFLVCLPVILNSLKLKRKSAFLVHFLFCILIGCMTGWSDSVTRAAIMSVCVFAGRDWLSALSLASLVMTLADPFCPLSSGFQMSFCAVLGIKVYSPKISELLTRIHFGENLSALLAAALSASLGMIPFWTDIAMRPDIEHLLIQMAGSFAAGLTCTCFVPCVFLCVMLPPLSQYLSAPLLVCLKCLQGIVELGTDLSERGGAPVHLSGGFLILLGAGVFLFFLPPSLIRRLLLKPACLLLAVMVGLNAVSILKKPDCRIVFADVGQGDCCLIMTPSVTCLIDAGTYEEGASTVSDLLDYYGIYQVDVCIMSHWDVDHAGGIAALSVQGRTKSILTSYVPGEDDHDRDVADFFKATGLKEREKSVFLEQLDSLSAGDSIALSDTVNIDVLYPYNCSGGGNEESLVLMLNVAGKEKTSVLFTGDIGKLTEDRLVADGASIDCDILKVAHHGSKYSSSQDFLDKASPHIAVISVGAHNFYGHPSPAALERLELAGCKVFRTDQEGAVILEY